MSRYVGNIAHTLPVTGSNQEAGRLGIRRPALRAQLVLDGDTALPVLLDGNLDEDWGDCLYLQPILHHGEHKTHTVELTILPADTPDAAEFYLTALIAAG